MTHPAELLIIQKRDIITYDEWINLCAQALIEQEDDGHMEFRTRYIMDCIVDGKIKVTNVRE